MTRQYVLQVSSVPPGEFSFRMGDGDGGEERPYIIFVLEGLHRIRAIVMEIDAESPILCPRLTPQQLIPRQLPFMPGFGRPRFQVEGEGPLPVRCDVAAPVEHSTIPVRRMGQ